jgi:hypothetical protein
VTDGQERGLEGSATGYRKGMAGFRSPIRLADPDDWAPPKSAARHGSTGDRCRESFIGRYRVFAAF